MEKYGLNEIREAYLSFFEKKAHLRLQSASLVPKNDKSLLLIAAGMAPLKPYFTGKEVPPGPRAVSCQKCVRTNDIENVGVTARHCTFFEMLGNFSFGDYFKEDAITWAWEFLTETLSIPANLLYPSVYEDDDEAFGIWKNKVGIPPERITRLGKDDNFWEHGAGPCGPCSELYYDRGEAYGCGKPDCGPGCECDRFVEIWNLVFTQFNKEEDGSYSPLAKKNIDTGMGLERTAAVLQGANTVYDVDTLKHVVEAVVKIAGIKYGESKAVDTSVRIITDHARAVTFMLTDGILPSNEGRGYVLRRLLRRAALHGKLLGINGGFLREISKAVVEVSAQAYPELKEKVEYVNKIIEVEENRFNETLDVGMEQLKKLASGTSAKALTPDDLGVQAFVMYDTFGFPPELTQEMLVREGIGTEVNMAVFEAEMEKQRTRARGARAESNFMGAEETALTRLPADMATEFLGYTEKTADAQILALIVDDTLTDEAIENTDVIIIPSATVLYAESGGQKADTGFITTETGRVQIADCQKAGGNKSAHFGKVVSGLVKTGQKAVVSLDIENRADTARNHTAAHLLHKALRETLGGHAEQAGSLVTAERLRFDFTHFQPMTDQELKAVEDSVNDHIRAGLNVCTTETSIQEAREKGALALFGEKYGEIVRVVDMSGYSVELCGGTHLDNTGKIGWFKILSEIGVAAGVRRIEAVTGRGAVNYCNSLEERLNEAASLLKTDPNSLLGRINGLLNEKNSLQKELDKLREKDRAAAADDYIKTAETVNGVTVVTASPDITDVNAQRALADKLREKLGSGVIMLVFKSGDKATLIVTATDDAVKSGVHCGNIVKETARAFGGNGGGKPNMAQAGLPGAIDVKEAIDKAKSFIS